MITVNRTSEGSNRKRIITVRAKNYLEEDITTTIFPDYIACVCLEEGFSIDDAFNKCIRVEYLIGDKAFNFYYENQTEALKDYNDILGAL
jgi:cobyrinic acid a,c-diamide synthase